MYFMRFMCALSLSFTSAFFICPPNHIEKRIRQPIARRIGMKNDNEGKKNQNKGFGKPKIDAYSEIQKNPDSVGNVRSSRQLLLQFTCNRCEGRTTLKINKLAYEEGVVICTCSNCGVRHLIADNQGLMGDTEFGRGNLEEYLARKGRSNEVTHASLPTMDAATLEKFDLTASETVLEVIPKSNQSLP